MSIMLPIRSARASAAPMFSLLRLSASTRLAASSFLSRPYGLPSIGPCISMGSPKGSSMTAAIPFQQPHAWL